MALPRMWLRLRNFRRWKKATTPMLLNADTGELIPFSIYTPALPTGKWIRWSVKPPRLWTTLKSTALAKSSFAEVPGVRATEGVNE